MPQICQGRQTVLFFAFASFHLLPDGTPQILYNLIQYKIHLQLNLIGHIFRSIQTPLLQILPRLSLRFGYTPTIFVFGNDLLPFTFIILVKNKGFQ